MEGTKEAGNFNEVRLCNDLLSVPSVAPKQVSVQSKGPYSILVKWSPMSSKDVNGVLMGYNVHYKQIVARNKRSNSAGVVQATNVSSPSVEIVGLKPFSLYRITVAAFTKKGNGPPSAPATLRTDEEGRARQSRIYIII